MACDSQAALIALNRFGLGARGGASGDFPQRGLSRLLSLRDLIYFSHFFRAQIPVDRFHVLLDLLDTGGAGDDA